MENKNLCFFIKVRKDEIELSEKETKRKGSLNSKDKVSNTNTAKSLPANKLKEYNSQLNTVNNILIFTEFIKELISILIHKFHFENLVENMYELYSNMLDNFYINNTSNSQTNS